MSEIIQTMFFFFFLTRRTHSRTSLPPTPQNIRCPKSKWLHQVISRHAPLRLSVTMAQETKMWKQESCWKLLLSLYMCVFKCTSTAEFIQNQDIRQEVLRGNRLICFSVTAFTVWTNLSLLSSQHRDTHTNVLEFFF